MGPAEFALNLAASGVALMRGIASDPVARVPEKPLELFEMEGCPYCRLVREHLSRLSLDVLIRPCPREGLRFRPLAREIGGREQFPFLVDPNTGVALYESADIVEYLHATYGGGAPASRTKRLLVELPGSFAASALRVGRGLRRRAARAPELPLELWAFEGSPFARPVRERLCEFEIPYLLHSIGRTQWQDWVPPPLRARALPDYTPETAGRRELLARTGRVQVPYLYDPNTREGLFESGEILSYLENVYG